MLIVTGSARAVPERRAELVTAIQRVVTSTRTDDGCRSYTFAADLSDPDTIISVETWRDQAALDAHMGHRHTKDFLACLDGLLDGAPDVAIHQVPDGTPA